MQLLLILTSLGCLAHGARILAVLPFPSKSHSILHYTIFHLLAQRGHEVVVYSVYPPPYSIANLTYTHLPSGFSDLTNSWTLEQFHEMAGSTNFYGCTSYGIFAITTAACEDVFKNENIKELLESDQKFDLIFFEFTFGQESLSVFSHKFKAPIINFQGFTTWSLVDWVAGNSLSISHIPEAGSFSFTNKMSFKERLQNFLSTVLTFLYYHYEHIPNHQRLVEKYYKDPSMPHVSEMLKQISITLINSQPSLEYPRPYTPNMIPIGGAHMSTHMTPLPQDIKIFIENAKQGFIFLSLGTFVPEHNMPSKYIQAFVNAFKRLPQKILWKTGIKNIPDLPENVKLTKWVPQPTVLGHPNCVLFMTHGGLFSQHETFHSGVPVVGIPFFTEQRFNMKFYESLGVGITLELNEVTEETVYKTITTLLNNPSYKENAMRVSSIVRDQPMSPADKVVFWVEYVLRHDGAPHLKPASVYLRWYELLMVDVILTLFVITLLIIYLCYYVIRRVLKLCFGNTRHLSSAKKKN